MRRRVGWSDLFWRGLSSRLGAGASASASARPGCLPALLCPLGQAFEGFNNFFFKRGLGGKGQFFGSRDVCLDLWRFGHFPFDGGLNILPGRGCCLEGSWRRRLDWLRRWWRGRLWRRGRLPCIAAGRGGAVETIATWRTDLDAGERRAHGFITWGAGVVGGD